MSFMDLVGRISLNATGWERGLAQVQARTNTFTGNLTNQLKSRLAGAFSAAAAIAASRAVIDYASNIKDLASRLSISTDTLQAWGFAAEQTGAKVDDVTKAVERLAVSSDEALENPTSKAARAFRTLGISMEDLKTLSMEDLFRRVGDEIGHGSQSASNMAAQVDLLGKSAGRLRNAFSEGLEQFENLSKGIIIDQKDIDIVEKYGDKWAVAGQKIKGAGVETVSFFARAHEQLTVLGQNILDLISSVPRRLGSLFGSGIGSHRLRDAIFDEEFEARKKGRETSLLEFHGERALRIKAGDMEGLGVSDEDIEKRRAERMQQAAEDRMQQFSDEERFWYEQENKEVAKKRKAGLSAVRSSDSLTAIGNFLGSSSDPTAVSMEVKRALDTSNQILRQQLEQTRQMNQTLLQIANIGPLAL